MTASNPTTTPPNKTPIPAGARKSSKLANLKKKFSLFGAKRAKRAKAKKLFKSGLPMQLAPVIDFLIDGKRDADTELAAKTAEARRAEIAARQDQEAPIWYSPKPGSAGADCTASARPQPGQVLNFSMKRIAQTGKNQKWGTVLHLLAKSFECRTGFELGSCAGISAMYLSSAPSVQTLVTVEGSETLANLAAESLRDNPNAQVVNSLFDEAIDKQAPFLEGEIDLAYIDGHHEKIATIHYFNRLLPYLKSGALVLFDDICWSLDMREAWEALCERSEFAHTIDFGEIGVCLLKSAKDDRKSPPKNWNLQPILEKRSIGSPAGWKLDTSGR